MAQLQDLVLLWKPGDVGRRLQRSLKAWQMGANRQKASLDQKVGGSL
jgi:hypothetical protein